MAKRYNTIEEFLVDEVVHESNVRAMTDDFSVVDNVMKEERYLSKEIEEDYDQLHDDKNCSCELNHFEEE